MLNAKKMNPKGFSIKGRRSVKDKVSTEGKLFDSPRKILNSQPVRKKPKGKGLSVKRKPFSHKPKAASGQRLSPKEAFDLFNKKYKDKIERECKKLAPIVNEDSDDLIQQCYITAWEGANHEGYDGEKGLHIVSYLYRRVIWKIADFKRKSMYKKSQHRRTALSTSSEDESGQEFSLIDYHHPELNGHSSSSVGWIPNQHGLVERRIVARNLIDRILLEAESFSPEQKKIVHLVFDSSKQGGLQEFSLNRMRETNKGKKDSCANEAYYEICSLKDLTVCSGAKSDRDIHFVFKLLSQKIPELSEIFEMF